MSNEELQKPDQSTDENAEVAETVEEKARDEELQEYKQGWQRAQADYQNLKKEVADMRSEWVRMSTQQIIEDFLPVYDNFKKAFASQPETDETAWQNWAKGIQFIQKQFSDVLQTHGVEEMQTIGETFDPNVHECVGEEDSDKDAGTILKEVDGGYLMKEKVIKIAKVIIST